MDDPPGSIAVAGFVRAALPPPPARVLEVGAGSGELAEGLAQAGYDVLAIDPASQTPHVRAVPLHELEASAASFEAAAAVVSLHHVEPLEESCRRLGELLRPGGVLVIDEFDVARFDERAARWLIDARGESLAEERRDPKALIAELRHHLHTLVDISDAASDWDTMRIAYYDERVIDRLGDFVDLTPTWSCADIGTGTGFVAAGIAPRVAKVIGIDISERMLGVARPKLDELAIDNADLREGEITALLGSAAACGA